LIEKTNKTYGFISFWFEKLINPLRMSAALSLRIRTIIIRRKRSRRRNRAERCKNHSDSAPLGTYRFGDVGK